MTSALLGALNGARNKGQLKSTAWPTLSLDAPKRPEWGDLASTVAMSLRPLSNERLTTSRRSSSRIFRNGTNSLIGWRIVRPGFPESHRQARALAGNAQRNRGTGSVYGTTDVGKGRRALVEYVSANPTGPLHVGHGRGAAVGQAVASLLHAVGFDVVSEYYINDAGRQMKLLGSVGGPLSRTVGPTSSRFRKTAIMGAYVTRWRSA